MVADPNSGFPLIWASGKPGEDHAQPALFEDLNIRRKRLLRRGDARTRDRQLPLTDDELAEASRYVFPAVLGADKPSTHPHITDPKASWRRLRIRSGIQDLRPHDLRRTIGSWMAIGGASIPIIGAFLGHKDAHSTAIYARLSDGSVRAAMESATAAMNESVRAYKEIEHERRDEA